MYESFAQVYDLFMDEVPYEDWCARILQLFEEAGIDDGLVLDLGCGTGSLTCLLADHGYDMIGVDASPEMLDAAREKCADHPDVLLLEQDMREFELYGTVRAVVCACDTLNYVSGEDELLQVFRLVNNYLDPGGLFLFDMNTAFKYRNDLGNQTFAESREEGAYIWDNFWDEEEQVNEYDLTLFIREEGTKERFLRFEEVHTQTAFPMERVLLLLKEAGLVPGPVYDGYTGEPAREESRRLVFTARECRKAEAVQGKYKR